MISSSTNTITTSKNNDVTNTIEHQFALNEEEVSVEFVTPENTKRQSKSQESVPKKGKVGVGGRLNSEI